VLGGMSDLSSARSPGEVQSVGYESELRSGTALHVVRGTNRTVEYERDADRTGKKKKAKKKEGQHAEAEGTTPPRREVGNHGPRSGPSI